MHIAQPKTREHVLSVRIIILSSGLDGTKSN